MRTKILTVVLASIAFLSPASAAEFLVQIQTGLLIPQQEVADQYRSSFAYGGALQVSFPGPKKLKLGVRAELFYSSLRPRTEVEGFKNSFNLMPIIGSAVVSLPLGNEVRASLLGGVGFYRNDWTVGAKSNDQFYMGYNGGMEVEMGVMPGVAIGVQTRYHLVTGCQGESDDKYLTTMFVINLRHAHGSGHS